MKQELMSFNEGLFTPSEKEKLLREIWILHDARWFLKTVGEVGFDTATKINLAVARSFGKTEMKRLLVATGPGEIKNMADLKALMRIAADLYFPEEHKYEFEILDQDTLIGHVLECYVYKHVNRAGTTEIHTCAATARLSAWMETCRLKGEVIGDKKTNNCNGSCRIRFSVKW